MFSLEKMCLYPHFVILKEVREGKVAILDLWPGKEIKMAKEDLMKSVSYVRNKLKISSKLIKVL